MKYIYSFDNFGRCYLEYKGNSKTEFQKVINYLYKNFLDENIENYLEITTKEKNAWLIEKE